MKTYKIWCLAVLCLTLASCGRKSIDEQFEENARQESQQMCPRKIDDCTMLDSIAYDIKTRTQNHYYTFSDMMDDESIFTDNFLADIRESMLKNLRNEIKLKKQMEAGISFGYHYRSASTGKTLLKIIFSKKDYTGPMKMRSFNQRITGKWEDYTQKNCPEEQDECTTLLRVAYDSTKHTIHYDFELKGELDIDSFTVKYPDAQKELKKMLRRGIKENSTLKEERDSMVDYNIMYTSKTTGKKVMEIKIKHTELK